MVSKALSIQMGAMGMPCSKIAEQGYMNAKFRGGGPGAFRHANIDGHPISRNRYCVV
jgi:hypothetical protein